MNASIRCSYASLSDLPEAADGWLSPVERGHWRGMRSAERRATWLAGRIVAKRLLKQCLSEPIDPAEIHIETRSAADNRGQRPSLFAWDQALEWALSIAHTARGVLVAIATEPNVTLGVDLVYRDELRSRRLAWCFTPAERRWLAEGPSDGRSPAQLWAMKEALYKACQQGEGFSPRQIEVVPGADPRYPMLDRFRGVRSLQGWRVCGHFAALAVADRARTGQDQPTKTPTPSRE